MSIRANLKIIDAWCEDVKLAESQPVILYHHCDGYPEWTGPHLEAMLEQCRRVLKENNVDYWWDSERISALLVALSAGNLLPDRSLGAFAVPTWQPSAGIHEDIDYLWEIRLGKEQEATIACYKVTGFLDNGEPELQRVDWQAAVHRDQANISKAAKP